MELGTESRIKDRRGWIATWAISFLIAILEGIDIQAIGVAAPRMLPDLGIDQSSAAMVFSASLLGLFFGAIAGGRLGDRLGRRCSLAISVAVFGVFSLLTAFAWDASTVSLARFLTGLGLGGAMPNLIAMVAETAPRRWASSLTTAVWMGTPIGGIIAGLMVAASPDWRWVFILGGIGPLVLVPLILRFLHDAVTVAETSARRPSVRHALMGDRRAPATLLLWAAFFFSLILLHLLLNWLPLLIQGMGRDKSAAVAASMWFNIGGCLGAIALAGAMRALDARLVVAAAYAGMAAGFVALASLAGSEGAIFGPAMLCGFFIIGGQFMLYGLAPGFYPATVRGTGVGFAVGAGRLGSVAGPFIVSLALATGYTIAQLLVSLTAIAAIAGTAMVAALTIQRFRSLPMHLNEATD